MKTILLASDSLPNTQGVFYKDLYSTMIPLRLASESLRAHKQGNLMLS